MLLVEDDERLSASLARGLRGEGYAVDVAATGEDGISHARVYEYDVVILDVMLPGPDGVSVCQTSRASDRWCPVLMLTARDGVADRIRGLDAGADDYQSSRLTSASWSRGCGRCCAAAHRERPAVLSAGDLELDPATRTVTRAGRLVVLSAREFAVLEYLLRRAGEVVSRSELLEHVWDRNFEGSTNIVDVYVGYLRRKLEEPFSRDDKARRRTGGAGLGLAICREIVLAHGGRIWVEDRKGGGPDERGAPQGTTIRLTLPLVTKPEAPQQLQRTAL